MGHGLLGQMLPLPSCVSPAVSLARPVLSCAHYFQSTSSLSPQVSLSRAPFFPVPITSKRLLRGLSMLKTSTRLFTGKLKEQKLIHDCIYGYSFTFVEY